jgi:hypothetical protein
MAGGPHAKLTWSTSPEVVFDAAPDGPDRPPTRSGRLLAWGRRRLASPSAHAVIIVVTLLMSAPMFWLDYDTDDYFQLAALDDGAGIAGASRAPWDLYAFANGRGVNEALRNEGVFPWWSDVDVRLAFFRPLASLSRWLDETLWPESIPTMQLHSLLWFFALLWAASQLYRRLLPVPWMGALALLLFASDDTRASTIAWLCNRNAPISLAFGFGALLFHHRARADGDQRARLIAPGLFAIGLLGGETALQVGGYLFAYAVTLDRAPLWRRFVTLLPYGAVVIVWGVVYKLLGYGAYGSAFYLDPVRDPLGFLAVLPERVMIYALSLFGGLSADLFDLLPVLGLETRPFQLPPAILCTTLMVIAIAPLFRRDKFVRFWAIGCLLSMLPACGVKPADRMLTAAALGGMALLAIFFGRLVDKTYPRRMPSWLLVPFTGSLVLANLIYAPLARPVLMGTNDGFDARLGRADRSIPRNEEIKKQTLVLVNPPWDTFAIFFPLYRAAHDLPRPLHYRWLATGVSDLTIARVDANTLRITPRDGYLSTASQQVLRSLDRPLHVGEKVALDGVTFEVLTLTDDRRPKTVEARFSLPLDSPELRFMRWREHEYTDFELPKVGESVTLPAADLVNVLQGA